MKKFSGPSVFTAFFRQTPVSIISLTDQVERRNDLIKKNVPADWVKNFFPATDFRQSSVKDLELIFEKAKIESRLHRSVRASEVGCSMSHLNVAKLLSQSPYNMAIVLEDDIIPASENWLVQLAESIEILEPFAQSGAAFVCLLGARHDQADHALTRRVVTKAQGVHRSTMELRLHVDPVFGLWRAHAYLISKGAAIRSTNKEVTISTLADDWNERRRLGFIDHVFYTRPILINQDEDRPSTIRPADHDDYYKPHVQINGFIRRIFTAIASRRFFPGVAASLAFRYSKIHARIMCRFPFYLP